jgi:hypothetical protein
LDSWARSRTRRERAYLLRTFLPISGHGDGQSCGWCRDLERLKRARITSKDNRSHRVTDPYLPAALCMPEQACSPPVVMFVYLMRASPPEIALLLVQAPPSSIPFLTPGPYYDSSFVAIILIQYERRKLRSREAG